MTWRGWLAVVLLCLAPGGAVVAGIVAAVRRYRERRANRFYRETHVSPSWLRRLRAQEDGTWPA